MTRYLVAAEADKIQDFVFRASHLREVSGGSALLTRFCQDVPTDCLGCTPDDVIISDGGSFRLAFDSKKAAQTGSRQLADLYYQATGCSLSVGQPKEWDGTDAQFRSVNELAGHSLRSAKRAHDSVASPQIPYIAFCTSTGMELAVRFASAKPGQAENYLSRSSLIKKQERSAGKEEFLQDFIGHVVPAENLTGADIPQEPGDVGMAGGYDARDYVAYLVADGNGMGAIFDQCQDSPARLKQLSLRLGEIVRDSLAHPTQLLMQHPTPNKGKHFVPVLPMILGGDDIFALLPAPWAFSFAREFCLAFEHKMGEFMRTELGLSNLKPTMAAAIVICKSKYPFALAHQRGERLLKEAKWLAKSQPGRSLSTINFEIVVGNRLGDASREGKYRPTQRPYWASAETGLPEDSVSIQQLLDYRHRLDALPQKRRTQLRAYYEPEQLHALSESHQQEKPKEKWLDGLQEICGRIGQLRDGDEVLASGIEMALETLGGEQNTSYWRWVTRDGESTACNGLADLLDAWDFLYDLSPDPVTSKHRSYEGMNL